MASSHLFYMVLLLSCEKVCSSLMCDSDAERVYAAATRTCQAAIHYILRTYTQICCLSCRGQRTRQVFLPELLLATSLTTPTKNRDYLAWSCCNFHNIFSLQGWATPPSPPTDLGNCSTKVVGVVHNEVPRSCGEC